MYNQHRAKTQVAEVWEQDIPLSQSRNVEQDTPLRCQRIPSAKEEERRRNSQDRERKWSDKERKYCSFMDFNADETRINEQQRRVKRTHTHIYNFCLLL